MIPTPGTRVRATAETRGFREGAEGVVLDVADPMDEGEVVVRWDDSQSGPSWTDPQTVVIIS